jgi:hypothetical protein
MAKKTKKSEGGTYGHFRAKRAAMSPGERDATDRANRAEVQNLLLRSLLGPPGRRPLRDNCNRTRPISTRWLAQQAAEDGKRGRFVERFIDSGLIAAEEHSDRTWIFDADELMDRWPALRRIKDDLLGRRSA